MKIICENRKAFFDYELIEKVEAGAVLTGTEVKAIRRGKASLQGSFVTITAGEAFLHDMQIAPYEQGNRFNHEEKRKRKLLLHAHQIKTIEERLKQRGFSIIPLKLYFKNSLIKVEIAIGRGKNLFDKRQSLKEKDVKRDLQRQDF